MEGLLLSLAFFIVISCISSKMYRCKGSLRGSRMRESFITRKILHEGPDGLEGIVSQTTDYEHFVLWFLCSVNRTLNSGFHHCTCTWLWPSQSRSLSNKSKSNVKRSLARMRDISMYAKLPFHERHESQPIFARE